VEGSELTTKIIFYMTDPYYLEASKWLVVCDGKIKTWLCPLVKTMDNIVHT